MNTGVGVSEQRDSHLDGMSAGWLLCLENLRLHLAHFRSQSATAAVRAEGDGHEIAVSAYMHVFGDGALERAASWDHA